MNNKTIGTLIAAFVVIVIVLIATTLYFTGTNGDVVGDTDETQVEDDMASGPYSFIDRVNAVQFYDDGTHIFAGEIEMPTPCDLLEWDVEVRESMPEQVHISFTVINEAEMCAQVITPARFMVEVQASEEATVTADFMGRDIMFNVREAAEDESPDDFELFIKG